MMSRAVWLSLFVIGCSKETGLSYATADPEATITSPADGDSFREGVPLQFIGVVTDEDTPTYELNVRWLLGGSVACEGDRPDADGQTICQIVGATTGTQQVTLEVWEEGGDTIQSTIMVTVDPLEAPHVFIDSPSDGEWFVSPGTLSGRVEDPDDALHTIRLWWESSLDGRISSPGAPQTDGTVEDTVTLTVGEHQLVLWAEDPSGQLATTSVTVTSVAEDGTPELEILTPTDGDRALPDDEISLLTSVTDQDDPLATLTVTWESDRAGLLAEETPDESGNTITTVSGLDAGEHILTATAIDPAGREGTQSIALLIDSPPSQPEVQILPEGALSDESLTVAFVVPSEDPDGSRVRYTYEWRTGDGLVASTDEVLDAVYTRRDQVWTVEVTPTDGWQDGPSATAETVIGNAGPTVSVTLIPESPGTDDSLVAAWTAEDPDDDEVTCSFSWTVNGAPMPETGDTLDSAHYTRGDVVGVTLLPSDGELTGAAVYAEVGIGNSRPGAARITIEPELPAPGDELVCSVVAEAVDPDGDTLVYTFGWTKNGEAFGETTTTTWPDDTVPAPFVDYGQRWVCTVVPVDPDVTGLPSFAEVVTECPLGASPECPALSCKDILDSGASTGTGTYWLNPDGIAPMEAYCEMRIEGGGWTLVGRVHRADVDRAEEPENWFGTGSHIDPLSTNGEVWNMAPSSFGAAVWGDVIASRDLPLAMFALIRQTDGRVARRWFKAAPYEAFSTWFGYDSTPTPVCSNAEMTEACELGTITMHTEHPAAFGSTPLVGMEISAGCPIHMRLEGDLDDNLSGISACDGGETVTTDYATEWGHGLEIWLR